MIVSFLQLVEIRTKIASVIPMILGTLYVVYRFHRFQISHWLLMVVSLIAIDMATTAINHFFDFKKATKTHGYNYEIHNPIVKDNLRTPVVIGVIGMLIAIATISGIALYLQTNVVVLLLGGVSFAIGILYSAGPIPISSTPLGEFFSGLFMGFLIVFISVYIHVYDLGIVNLSLENGMLYGGFDIREVAYIFLFSIPTICCIANIMLANNICDMEDDKQNKRYTLPLYIGKKRALFVFKLNYYISYVALVISALLGIIPMVSLVVLLTILPVYKNIQQFYHKQSKKDTFALAIKNFILINVTNIIFLGGTLILAPFL